ncbi:hypothetical protein GA0115233_10712 [Streptomyces sp. DI166]|nr:hypothetical protein GA0115233_10712 [Streptomyces sp. DI166]
MAQLVRQQRVAVHVAFHAFGLQESDAAELPVPFPDDFDPNVSCGGRCRGVGRAAGPAGSGWLG